VPKGVADAVQHDIIITIFDSPLQLTVGTLPVHTYRHVDWKRSWQWPISGHWMCIVVEVV